MQRPMVMAATLAATFSLFAGEHTKDSLDEVQKNMKAGKAILLDVREKTEWDEGHIQSAKLLPLSSIKAGLKAEEAAKVLPKDKIIYCHCMAGRRSLEAAGLLEKLGYEIRPLKPGYMDLLKAGFPKAGKE